jgi:hypothetical protein
MGQYNRGKPTKYKKAVSAAESLFKLVDSSFGALNSILNSRPAGKRKKYYRVYKVK